VRPAATERQLVQVGRISAGVMVLLGLVWIPFMKYISSQIYIYLQSVQAYIAPPIAACFLLGLFYRRLNGSGAIASLITGLVLGLLRLILELTNKASGGGLTPGTLWHWIATINFLHYAVLLFVICTFVLFIVSMMTPPPPREKTEGLTYGGAPPTAGETKDERKFEVGLSVLLVILLGVLWIVFA
jgi:SSS family solute:Na+ symporter